MGAPILGIPANEIIVDSFAGGGGASFGIELALGRSPDVAINHNAEALALHKANHPRTAHYCENVWKVDPVAVCAGRRVGLFWASPDCTHHSKAKGGKPVKKRIRGLAWVVTRWAAAVKPRVICLENVEEFEDWGPLTAENKPDKAKAGRTFKAWVARLRRLGYEVQWRILRASDYGAPTSRRRLFVVARCDGQPIAWPKPTHGRGAGLLPVRTAAECIDWSIPCPSIFERERPLAENTLRRIARGVRRYVIDEPKPFIVGIDHASSGASCAWSSDEPLTTITAENRHALVSAFLAKHFGGNYTGPGSQLSIPMHTVTAVDHHALVTSHLSKLYGTSTGQEMSGPMPTVTGGGQHLAEVRAFLMAYYGSDQNPQLGLPLPTVTSHDRFGLVMVQGQPYRIVDIGMRMLAPRELYRAQGFPDSYRIEVEHNGRVLSKSAQVRMCGNSVCPPLAAALVRANYGERQVMAA